MRYLHQSEELTVAHSDAFEFLDAIPRESVDLVLTDPPYSSLEKHRGKGTTTRLKESAASSNAWFATLDNDALCGGFMRRIYEILKPGRHAYIVSDEETNELLKIGARKAGFYVWKSLVWVKTRNSSGSPLEEGAEDEVSIGMGYHYRNSTERILFLEKLSVSNAWVSSPAGLFGDGPAFPAPPEPKGKGRQLNNLAIPDVLFAPRVRGKDAYPTEKPVSLLRTLVEQSTQPGEVVLDPFCGSGSTGDAARSCGRRVLLSDVSPIAANRALERCLSIVKPTS